MKQLKKYCIGMLVMATLVFVTACGRSNNNGTTNNNTGGTGTTGTTTNETTNNGTMNEHTTTENVGNGERVEDYLFDTNGDGIYDHTDVDRDGLLEEIGRDANDVVDDMVNDVTGNNEENVVEHTDETVNNNGTVENNTTTDHNGTVEKEKTTKTP